MKACRVTSRRRRPSVRSSGTRQARSCSCSARTRVSGCTRPAGPTSAIRPPRSPPRRSTKRPGIECTVDRMMGVVDGQRMGFSRFGMYMLLFSCTATGGELTPHPLETGDVGWFAARCAARGHRWRCLVGADGVRCDRRRTLGSDVRRRPPRRLAHVAGAEHERPPERRRARPGASPDLAGTARLRSSVRRGRSVRALVRSSSVASFSSFICSSRARYSTMSSSSPINAATRASYSRAPEARPESGAGVPIIEQARSTRAIAALGDGTCDA